MNVLSLFSGIGGLELGLERTGGFRTVAQCEIDPFARAVLAKHWPDVRRFEDVTKLTEADLAGLSVDVVVGGFPCQDISVAGRGEGIGKGSRSGLWREMFRIIRRLEPVGFIIENVPALRSRGADQVLRVLERIGYACWPVVVGASDLGAPHRRQRVFIIGLANSSSDRGVGGAVSIQQRRQEQAHANPHGSGEGASVMLAHSALGGRGTGAGLRLDGGPRGRRESAGPDQGLADAREPRLAGRWRRAVGAAAEVALPASGGHARWPARPGEQQHEWEEPRLLVYPGGKGAGHRQPQQPVGGAAPGLPGGLVRPADRDADRLARWANKQALKAYGNAVVPQVAEAIGEAFLRLYELHIAQREAA